MITGQKGFLAQELTNLMVIPDDMIILMGCPTFDVTTLSKRDAQKLHEYVKETIEIVDNNKEKYIIFCSSDSINDIKFDHTGSTPYSVSKLFLENYIINQCDNHLILRIGTIVSRDIDKVLKMKPTRIQNQILNKKMLYMPPLKDDYLMLDDFVKETIEVISNRQKGIYEYNMTELSLSELIGLIK